MVWFFKKKLHFGKAIEDDYFNKDNLIFHITGYILFILSLFRLYLWGII